MWRISKRCTVIVACAAGSCGVAPAVAGAAQSVSVSSQSGFPAGGHPTVTITTGLEFGAGAPSAVSLTLAPGVLASVAAKPSCVHGVRQEPPPAACRIGGGTIFVKLLPFISFPFDAYLTPPSSGEALAGVELDVPQLLMSLHSDLKVSQTPSGSVTATMPLDLSSLRNASSLIGTITLTINGTLNGQPFMRMPTNCSPGSTSLTVVYPARTETSTASPDVSPAGCSALPYSPQLSASATEDSADNGVAVTTTISQGAGQAATRSATIALPSALLSPNLAAALSLLNSGTPVGSVTASSPLLTGGLTGHVFLTGSATAPKLTFRFPPPLALTLTGDVSLASNSMTFATLPDIPLSSLSVDFTGGPQALFMTTCRTQSGTLSGSFTGQNGAMANASQSVTVANCRGTAPTPRPHKRNRPAISGGFSGLGGAKPALRLSLTRGSGTAAIKTITVSLPGGLTFSRRGLRLGLVVGGAGKCRTGIVGGSLVITLAVPANHVLVSIKGSALVLGNGLARRLRHHQVKRLTARVMVKDAAGSTTLLTVR